MSPVPRAGSPRSGQRAGKPLLGCQTPRLFTPPLRRLTRHTTRGYEAVDFADAIGEPFLPWQRWLALHALELAPDGTFRFRVVLVLVGRQNGKSTAKRTISLWRLYVDGARLVLGAAQDLSLAREQWQAATETIEATPELAAELDTVRRTNGDEYFRLVGGGRYKIVASTRRAGRGLSVDELNIDELREQRDWAAWSALSKTTSARPNGQTWAMSNAGDDESVVLNQLREAALAGRDPSIGLFEWSAPDGCELDDRRAWAQANPGLGHTISEQAIASALATDPPAVFRTEVLCQRVDQLDGAVDLGAWRACADAAGTLDGARDRVVTCVDVSPDGHHVTLAAAAELDAGRVRIEIVRAWSSTSRELATELARRDLPELLVRVDPLVLGWFPTGPAAQLGADLRGIRALVEAMPAGGVAGRMRVVELKGAEAGEACMELAELVGARRLVHPGDPLLDAHVAGAGKANRGDGWTFTRRGGGHVDAAYAAAGAVHLARTLPPGIDYDIADSFG